MQVVYSPRERRVVHRSSVPPGMAHDRATPGTQSHADTSEAAIATDPFAHTIPSATEKSTRTSQQRSPAPQVTDLRRPSIDVLMMPSGPSDPPTEVTQIELGDPLSPRDVSRLPPVGEEAALAPEPQAEESDCAKLVASKQDRWAGGIVEGQGVYTGWMLKKGETGNGWKRRYFACSLASKTLSYYDKPGGASTS